MGAGRSIALSTLLLLASCKSVPTSVLLTLRTAPSVSALDQIKLTVFDERGDVVHERRLPAEGQLALPGTVVLYPSQESGTLRTLALGLRSGQPVAEGIGQVMLRRSEQVALTVTLEAGRRPDRDGDGVPDGIDNCPDKPNPEQQPCKPVDGGPGELGPREASAEAALDRGPDLACDQDEDGYRSIACGGDDCDDANPKVNPGQSESPPGSTHCSDGIDNDCDGKTDLADDGCKACSTAADCDDKNTCTADQCSNSTCTHAATNEGMSCTTTNKCFAGQTTCALGVCTGKAKDCSPPSQCLVGSCNPASGCTTTPKPDGTSCSDGDPCTTGETCKTGSCSVPSQPAKCYIGATCFVDGAKQGTCRICETAKSKTAWSIVAGTCLIEDGCYLSGASGTGCSVCDPTKSATSWSIKSSCGIVLAALNSGYSGNLGGIAGANALCQAQASAAGQSGTFKAFLSSSTQNVKDLVPGTSAQPVVNLKGAQLYASWAQIFTTSPWTAGVFLFSFGGKMVDENQGVTPDWVDANCWTGSLPAGTAAPDTCGDWTSTATSGAGGELDLSSTGNIGMMSPTANAACTTTRAVVCVQIP